MMSKMRSRPARISNERPTRDCVGYPPALHPSLPSNFADVDFYIPSSGESAPRLACTLTWYKGDYNNPEEEERVVTTSSFGDTCNTIQDVKSSINTCSEKRFVIVCHGFLSWRNQILISHVATGVAKEMKCHALRFDFRGNGSSGGTWQSAGFQNELFDLERVVHFIRNELGCKVACIIGHSKGSAAVLRFAREQGRNDGGDTSDTAASMSKVPCFVNMAGRYVEPGDFDMNTRYTKEQCKELKDRGQFSLETFGGKRVVVTQQDIDERANFDSSFVSEISVASVLTIHGAADATVPVENANKYNECIPRHTLKIIDGADHNFNGLKYMMDIVSSIVEFVGSIYAQAP